ncbi:DUF2062 domain-containing protein [Sphingomonas beigongshangi]|jgi:uncharacterized protein|uniref:DUF2062 domain-containing protein n=1 Tax=Sphingomonas beigongshangi TaxID=2782540 RepID=UPI001AEEB328|nr:DUF2062 domain-containing protein [Sphingomonas beigongshangi]
MASPWQRLVAWGHRNLPTRESMEANRLLRPVAHRVMEPGLWRFTRRSVPRGVALGVVAGFLFPVAQIAIAALFALPFRANVPVAALTTFITNPLTTPFLWYVAYRIGAWLLHSEAATIVQPATEAATGWLHRVTGAFQWLWAQGPSFALGLIVLTSLCAVAGYGASALGWRLWIARKWRFRHEKTGR